MTRILKMSDAAPQIDTILDAEAIPAWSRRAGSIIAVAAAAPGIPAFSSIITSSTLIYSKWIDHGELGGVHIGSATTYIYSTSIDFTVTASTGAVKTKKFEVDHRLSGTEDWTTLTIAVADGGGAITSYDNGDVVEMRVRAVASDGTSYSDYSSVVTVTVDGSSVDIPGSLDEDGISLTALNGGIKVSVAVPDDDSIAKVKAYYSTASTLDTDTAPSKTITVSAGGSYSITLGTISSAVGPSRPAMRGPSERDGMWPQVSPHIRQARPLIWRRI